MTRPAEIVPGIWLIDTRMGGREGVTSAYLIRGREPALVETGPTSSLEPIVDGLAELGIGPEDLAHVLLTHIHLDHAGGVGSVARCFPRSTIWVHERGAPHLVDPSKLVASTIRTFGEEHVRRVFGDVHPVAPERVRSAAHGELVSLGDRSIEVIHAPGHAVHHVFLADSETGVVFTGDGLGVLLPGGGVLRPGTPPPDFDLEQAVASIELVAERDPPSVLFSHFGPVGDVPLLCRLAVERLRGWAAAVERAMRETDDVAEVARRLRDTTAPGRPGGGPASDLERQYDLLLSYEVNAMGLMRYLRKRSPDARAEDSAASSPPPGG